MSGHPFIRAASSELVDRVRTGLLQLSPRDTITLIEMLNGLGNNEIEAKLNLTWNTVKASTGRIFDACRATRNEIIRVCCYDLIDDHDLFDALEKKVVAYQSNRQVVQRKAQRDKRPPPSRPGRRRTEGRAMLPQIRLALSGQVISRWEAYGKPGGSVSDNLRMVSEELTELRKIGQLAPELVTEIDALTQRYRVLESRLRQELN